MRRVLLLFAATALVASVVSGTEAATPASAADDFTYFSIVRETASGTESFFFGESDGTFEASQWDAALSMELQEGDGDWWRFGFGAPEDRVLTVGPYEGAGPERHRNPLDPWVSTFVPGNWCTQPWGSFFVGEMVIDGVGNVTSMAVDFDVRCIDSDDKVSGRLRFHATSDTMPVAPDDDGDGIPNTSDSCPGVSSPVATDTDGDRLADPCDPDYTITYLHSASDDKPQEYFVRPSGAYLTTEATWDPAVHVTYDFGEEQYALSFESAGYAPLTVGVYENVRQRSTDTNPSLSISGIDFCGGDFFGRFEIYELVSAGGELVTFSADFEYSCREGQAPEHYGSVRINADNSPVPISGTSSVDGTPTSGMLVEAVDQFTGAPLGSAVSVAGGAFTLGVVPVPVDVRAGSATVALQYVGPHALQVLTTAVSPGVSGLSGLQVDVRSGGILVGTAVPPGSVRIEEMGVHLYDSGGNQLTEPYEIPAYYAGGTSHFEVFGYSPGVYHVLAVPFLDDYAATWFPGEPSFYASEPVSIVAGEVTVADVDVMPAATLEVRVQNREGVEVEYPYGEVYNLADLSGLAARLPHMSDTVWYVAEGSWYVLAANYDYNDEIIWDYFPEWYNDAPELRPDQATPVSIVAGEHVIIDMVLDPMFPDMFGSVFADDIYWLRGSGITVGCEGGTMFCTDDPVTRGEMAAFLVRSLGLTDGGDVDFVDDDGSIFEGAIEKLAAAGITKGCNPPENDRFCPEEYVTRQQMAAFLVRALGLTDQGDADFVDDDWSVFEDAIEKLATAGITKGCNPPDNDRFCPASRVTRGQMAAFLHRALTLPQADGYATDSTTGQKAGSRLSSGS